MLRSALVAALTALSPALAAQEGAPPTEGAPAEPAPTEGAPAEPAPTAPEGSERNPIPRHRLWYRNAVFGRINPFGLIDQLTLGYRLKLGDGDGLLFGDPYLLAGLSARLSPAFGRVGGTVEFSPIAIWKLWVTYELVGYFGTFDQVIGFAEPSVRYSDRSLDAIGGATPRLGGVLTVGTTLQVKVGPVAARSTLQLTRYDLRLPDGQRFFYDQLWDRLAPNRGLMFLKDTDVMGIIGKVRVGARWTWSDGLVGDNDTDAGLAHHRVGPLFALQLHDRGPGARFDQPTIFVLAQWWAQHPYRRGQEQHAALPMIAVGFAMQGDLLGPKPPGRGKVQRAIGR